MFEYTLCGKWPELLKEIAPNVTHAAVLRDPTFVAGIGQFAVIQAVAPSAGIEVSPIDLLEPNQIEPAIATFAQSPNGGLIVTVSGIAAANVNVIIAAQFPKRKNVRTIKCTAHRFPAYPKGPLC
jgi:putative tryptophan/tyrosine transport system substrate-binding protein